MLPPGHIAAGYLAAEITLRTFHFNLTPQETQHLIWLGTFFAFMPDLDFFVAFAKVRKLRIDNDKANHRRLITHAPFVWLVISIVFFVALSTDFGRAASTLLLVGTWAHFILDSEWGITWYWPFSDHLKPFSAEFYRKKYAESHPPKSLDFWKYWSKLAWDYYRKPQAWIEIILVIIAIISLIKH